jgi:myosin-5
MAFEWRAGMHVWMPQKDGSAEPFLPGQVSAVTDGGLKVNSEGTEQLIDLQKDDVLAGNDPGATAPDHTSLIFMNEPCVIENSRLRFLADQIYTLVGTILIAINPFASIPGIYGEQTMEAYSGKELGDPRVDSHVYAMGEAAYRTMLRSSASTVLVMSGESGAGKTETTKHVMNYIAWCSNRVAGEGGGGLAQQLANMIIMSSPLLEAFGNAKTVRNNNSSRFGKMMRLHFKPTGEMVGAFVKTYLLEKIRCVAITSPERNYHIFYQLLAARPEPAKHVALTSRVANDLRMLNRSSCTSIDGVDDAMDFAEVCDAMRQLGVAEERQTQLWRVLSGLLVLGNVDFNVDGGEKAVVSTPDVLSAAEELLGNSNLAVNLTSKGSGRKSLGALMLTKPQAEAARDAVIKDIYVGPCSTLHAVHPSPALAVPLL